MVKKVSIKNRLKIFIPYLLILFISFQAYSLFFSKEIMYKQIIITSLGILIFTFIFFDDFWNITIFYLLFGITMLYLSQQISFVESVLLDMSLPGVIPILFKGLAYESYKNNILLDLNLLSIKSSIYVVVLYAFNLSIFLIFKTIKWRKNKVC